MAQDHLAIFDEACLVGSDLLSERRDLPVGVRVCGQRTSVSPGRRCAGTAEGAAAPPANAGRDSKQLVTADPAEKMAARRPGDAAGALNAAAVATSSPMTSRQQERIGSTLKRTLKRASLACFGALADLRAERVKTLQKAGTTKSPKLSYRSVLF